MTKYFERFHKNLFIYFIKRENFKYGITQGTNSHPNPLSTERGNRTNPPQGGGQLTKSAGGVGGFTLVELIVVIVILAILGTIAFISLQGYASSARDTKRLSDVRSLINKIVVENAKGVNLSQLISTGGMAYTMSIYQEIDNIYIGVPNFESLHENSGSFQDPHTSPIDPTGGKNYLMAYSAKTKRVAGMYTSETTGKNVCIGEIQLFDKYEVAKCNEGSNGGPTPTYSWQQTENWSTCSVECGGGTQAGSVICKNDLNGQQVNDNNCDIGNKLTPLTQSCNNQACSASEPPVNNPNGDVVLCTNTNKYWAKPSIINPPSNCNVYNNDLKCNWSSSTTGQPYSISNCISKILGTNNQSESVSGCNVVGVSGNSFPAFQACINLGNGWRLPTIEELWDLYNCNEKSALNLANGSDISAMNGYFSSTDNNDSSQAWYLILNDVPNINKPGFPPMALAGQIYIGTKMFQRYVVCIHDGD